MHTNLVKIGCVFPEICSRTDTHTRTDRHGHHNAPLPCRRRSNKSVFSFLRIQPAFARHTPLLLSAGCAAIGRYLLPAGHTATNLQQRVCCCGLMLGQTDGRTPYRYRDLATYSNHNNDALNSMSSKIISVHKVNSHIGRCVSAVTRPHHANATRDPLAYRTRSLCTVKPHLHDVRPVVLYNRLHRVDRLYKHHLSLLNIVHARCPHQRWTWVGSIHGLGWVGSHFPARVIGWVGLNEKYCYFFTAICLL